MSSYFSPCVSGLGSGSGMGGEMEEASPKTPSSIRVSQDSAFGRAAVLDREKFSELRRERERDRITFEEEKAALGRVETHRFVMSSGLQDQQKEFVQVSLSTPIPDQRPFVIKFHPEDTIRLLRDYAFEIMRTAGMDGVQLHDVIIERTVPRELLPAEGGVTFTSKSIKREKIIARVKKSG